MSTQKLFTGILLVFSLLLASACQGKVNTDSTPVPLPATLLGTWHVVEVLIDQGDSRWHQTRDDPYNVHEYLGRVFTFTPQRISFNGLFKEQCEEPKIIEHHTTLAAVINTSMSSRPLGPPPTPKDFHLPIADSAPIDLSFLWCGKEGRRYIDGLGNIKDGVGERGAWLTILNQDQLMLRWRDETFLILKRLSGNEAPVASFDCTKAATSVEKTICGSVALAAYDQSVTQSFKQALAYYQTKEDTKETIAELKKSQKLWLKQRNTCGSDAVCLDKSMGERIFDINQVMADYTYEHRAH